MNTQQLKNFVTAAERRSITRAAEELLVAQPALSQQIKAIEESVGAKLFIRKPRSVELTEAGKVFYDMAKRVLRIEENMATELANIAAGNSGVLKLGMTPAYPDTLLSGLLFRYREAYPNVDYDIYEKNSDELLTELESGDIELAAIHSAQSLPPDFQELCAFPERLYAFRRADTPCFGGDELLPPERLRDVPVCVPRGLRASVINNFRSCGVELRVCSVSASRNMAMEMARITGGAALVSASELSRESAAAMQMSYQPVDMPEFNLRRAFVIRRGRTLSAAARNFTELIQKRDG